MPVPPALTAAQRSDAATKSLWVRQQRAATKGWLADGTVTFSDVWTFPTAQGMKVYSLLRAVPGVGEATANRLLDEAGIGRHLSVAQCGPRQADRLFGLVDQLPRR